MKSNLTIIRKQDASFPDIYYNSNDKTVLIADSGYFYVLSAPFYRTPQGTHKVLPTLHFKDVRSAKIFIDKALDNKEISFNNKEMLIKGSLVKKNNEIAELKNQNKYLNKLLNSITLSRDREKENNRILSKKLQKFEKDKIEVESKVKDNQDIHELLALAMDYEKKGMWKEEKIILDKLAEIHSETPKKKKIIDKIFPYRKTNN